MPQNPLLQGHRPKCQRISHNTEDHALDNANTCCKGVRVRTTRDMSAFAGFPVLGNSAGFFASPPSCASSPLVLLKFRVEESRQLKLPNRGRMKFTIFGTFQLFSKTLEAFSPAQHRFHHLSSTIFSMDRF